MKSWHPYTNPIFLSIVIGLMVYLSARQAQSYRPKGNSPLYSSRLAQYAFLPVAVIILLILLPKDQPEIWFSLLAKEILTLSVCLGLLLLLLPLLHRFLQAESCAALWCIFYFLPFVSFNDPQWIVSLPFRLPNQWVLSGMFWLWLTGFVSVLAWHIVRHLLFRHRLLKNAKPLDGDVSAAFHKRLQIANLPAGYISAVCTPDAKAPVSMGLFSRTSYLVLPEKRYTQEELALIFQHEIIHLSRGDNHLKFTLILFSAFLWFHPLVWVALRICAADLELSCDEAVIYGRTPEDRKAYASLLLHTKAEEQGFTTCLSASAKSLRYRLKNIVHPKKRIVGAIFVGLLCYGLLSVGMNIGVRFAPAPAKEQIFPGEDLSQMQIMNVTFNDGGTENYARHTGPAILEYIAELSVSTDELTGSFVHPPDELWVLFELKSPQHIYRIRLWDNYLTVSTFDQDPDTGTFHANDDFTRYHLEAPPDWEYMFSLILPNYLLGQS